jgi:hypothetical protein
MQGSLDVLPSVGRRCGKLWLLCETTHHQQHHSSDNGEVFAVEHPRCCI